VVQFLLSLLFALLPVLVFLAALVFLDSFKLVRMRSIILAIFIGCCTAGISMGTVLLLRSVVQDLDLDLDLYSRYGAPVLEEFLKAVYVFLLIRSRKVGFMVDAAIYGFAVGTGFALVENVYYIQAVKDANIFLWVIRGFGTAIMHGGTTTVFAVLGKVQADRKETISSIMFLPGLGIAFVIHSFYNHFFLSPIHSTLMILIVLPATLAAVFQRSEKSTRRWLGVGFDTDVDMLNMILTGDFTETPVGKYLMSLQEQFKSEIIADMLCLLRLHLELSVRAKGILLMREAGFREPPDPEVKEKFSELNYLRKAIGPTGLMAVAPVMNTSSRDLWQMYMLEQS
jgi:RsiW-degrading membrane proteinase PrsW (M82 family)